MTKTKALFIGLGVGLLTAVLLSLAAFGIMAAIYGFGSSAGLAFVPIMGMVVFTPFTVLFALIWSFHKRKKQLSTP